MGGPCLQPLLRAAWCSDSPCWQAVSNSRSRFAHNIHTVCSLTRNWVVLTRPDGGQQQTQQPRPFMVPSHLSSHHVNQREVHSRAGCGQQYTSQLHR